MANLTVDLKLVYISTKHTFLITCKDPGDLNKCISQLFIAQINPGFTAEKIIDDVD
jgi:hypothetical protein